MDESKKKFTKEEINLSFSQSKKVTVVFTKKDGSLRTMLCTKDIETIPEAFRPKVKTDSDKPAKPTPDHLVSAFDLEANGWRSFVVDNVISVDALNETAGDS